MSCTATRNAALAISRWSEAAISRSTRRSAASHCSTWNSRRSSEAIPHKRTNEEHRQVGPVEVSADSAPMNRHRLTTPRQLGPPPWWPLFCPHPLRVETTVKGGGLLFGGLNPAFPCQR